MVPATEAKVIEALNVPIVKYQRASLGSMAGGSTSRLALNDGVAVG